jgi:hypothetical protein
MMNLDNDEERKKVNYEEQRKYNIDVEKRILIISRKGNCDHDASLRVMMCRQIFII